MTALGRPFREHFLEPSPTGALDGPRQVGEAENRACGDWVRIELRVRQGAVAQLAYQVRGCSATIACASLAAESIPGRTPASALALDLARLAESRGATLRDLAHAPSVVARAVRAALAAPASACQSAGTEP